MNIRQERRAASARPRGTTLTIAVAIMSVWGLAACSTVPASGQATPAEKITKVASASRSGPAWLLTRSALSQLVADSAVRDELRGSRVYEILQPGQRPVPGVTAEPVVTFASAAALEGAVTGGRIPGGTYGVLYDPEAWSFTPKAEQRNPVRAATRAAAVAHAHGLRLIVTPALNLTTVLAPGGQAPRWRQFLDLNLAGRLAKVADVVELQAQSLERSTATYTSFVRAARSQVARANPGAGVLAGLSTNPPGAPVTSQHLTAAIQSTRSVVAGYWFNIPGQGARCPTCNAARPDIAIETLRALGA